MSTSGEFESEINNSSSSNSFWELKQYGRCVRRLENGNKLCTDICNMIQDRVEIEKIYSASLHKWSSKLTAYLECGSEYGSTKGCWTGWCIEADALSELHKDTRNRLVDEVQSEVRNWQKDHYHKSTLPPQHLKEAKSLESDFEIAQKPWAKKLKKMGQCKKDYHQQCKSLRSYEIQNKNATNEGNITQEQLKKLEEKVKKTEKDVEKLKIAYESSLQELAGDCSRYTDEMTKVFNKSQLMERDRMEFFKTIFSRMQKILNFSENKSLPNIYCDFGKTIECLDPDLDVKQWSQSYGTDMAFICPQFEEYTPELASSITKKKPNLSNETGVVLTSINSSSRQTSIRSGDIGSRSAIRTSTGTESSTPSPNLDVVTPVSASALNDQIVPLKPRRLTSVDSQSTVDEKQGIDKRDSVEKESPVFGEESGVRVKALYDYNGAEEDELTLIQGEIFIKLEDEDEQGWCRGKKDGRVGLYPANYAESV